MSPSHVPALGWTALIKPSLFEKKNKLQSCPTGAPSSFTSVSSTPPAEEGASSCEMRVGICVVLLKQARRVLQACLRSLERHKVTFLGRPKVMRSFLCLWRLCLSCVSLQILTDVSPSPLHFLQQRAPRIERMPHLPTCFFLCFNQGPQRHRKESDSSGASGDSRAQQTSHDRFNEGGTSFQSQGGSREHWVQAPAVGRHTRIIQQLRKSNPLCTRVEPVVNLFELCAIQAP